ncbi:MULTISPECIES: helix-turn-helix domain-containing protein [Sphingobacterium]|uniref:helix-turn-helix domain-containing protein n=1 Tax=Sphingobacterium TaxID=28453 RepID=UPI0034D96509
MSGRPKLPGGSVNRCQFEGYCQVAFGRSLHKHIRDMRMGTVVRLLVDTDMSVRTIIASVGYSHGSNFFRLFLIYFGLSPAEYRKKNR